MARFKSLAWFLRDKDLQNTDSLHLAAIENLRTEDRAIERWWRKKYRVPPKKFEDHVREELVVEMLEDFYEANPAEIERFLFSLDARIETDWDGTVSDEHERRMKKRFKNPDVLNKYRDKSEELTPEQEAAILNNLGKDLPKSKMVTTKEKNDPKTVGDFDETF